MKEKTIWHPGTEFPESGAYVLVVYNGRLREQTVNQKILANFFETSSGDHVMAVGRYLFQPAKVLRKAGAFRLLSARYGVAKLAPSTHLYTADEPVAGFPGKCLAVEEVLPWGNAARRELGRRFARVELTALNFPMTTDELRKRLGLPGGGGHHVFATTVNNEKVLIICAI